MLHFILENTYFNHATVASGIEYFTIEIAAWVIWRTSTQDATHPSAQQMYQYFNNKVLVNNKFVILSLRSGIIKSNAHKPQGIHLAGDSGGHWFESPLPPPLGTKTY
jgi:hypothetical protein